MIGHTPGPWEVELDVGQDGDIGVFAEQLTAIAFVNCREVPEDTDPPREQALANARLIASAPDLLEALKNAENYLDSSLSPCEARCECIIHLVWAAIAKAEGRS